MSISNPSSANAEPPKQFTFDSVYDHTNTQREIYEETALPIVRAAMEGYNGTVFCYGQTGTGKTHTMEGSLDPPAERGIIPNAFDTVFADIDASEAVDKTFLVRASFLEIYNENVRDLLAKDQTKTCALKETPEKGVYVDGLTTFVVKSAEEMREVLEVGKKNRSVGATLMNADSSRSHSIFTVTVETSETTPGEPSHSGEARIRVGKLNLVDLAGSERQSKTQASGDRRRRPRHMPVPRLEADAAAAGLARRQHQDGDGRQPRPGRLELRRDALDAALRQPREEHQEQAQDQRGPLCRDGTKVVKGGTNLLDQEQRLVEEARIREEKMRKMETVAEEQRRRIEDLENLDSIAGESYASVDEEIESKTSKIERLKQAYRRCAADIEDLDDEFVQERDELLEQVRALTRRIKLKNLVLDFCVPPERLAEISERCRWDDGAERWVLEHAAAAVNQSARARAEGRASARLWRRRNYSAAAGPYRGEERNANVPRRMVYGFARASAPEARFRRKKKRSSRFRSPRGGWSAPSRTSRATRRARERWPRARMRRRCSPRTSPTTRSRRGGMYKVAKTEGAPPRRMRAATRRFPTGRRPRRRARARPRGALGPGRPGTPGAAGTRAWTRYVRGNLTPRGFRSRGGW